jgi:hypothetical protein
MIRDLQKRGGVQQEKEKWTFYLAEYTVHTQSIILSIDYF